MVNHFASLLANIPSGKVYANLQNYVVGAGEQSVIGVGMTTELAIEDFYSSMFVSKGYNPLINKDYIQLALPYELQRFSELLFEGTYSDYYKQFMLFSYLRLVATTDRAEDVKKHDSRITYNLDEFDDYFSFPKMGSVISNDTTFKLLTTGTPLTNPYANAAVNEIVVRQVGKTQNVLIYSNVQKLFYKPGKAPSKASNGMEVTLTLNPTNSAISQVINIEGTGLSFYITGPFNGVIPSAWQELKRYSVNDTVLYDSLTYTAIREHSSSNLPSSDSLNWKTYTPTSFLTKGNKVWVFSYNAPAKFDVVSKIKEVAQREQIVDDMLDFSKDLCDSSYENIWKTHYNDIYKFAGLLLAYVERVNLVWLKSRM
jgi:hypothetical protein